MSRTIDDGTQLIEPKIKTEMIAKSFSFNQLPFWQTCSYHNNEKWMRMAQSTREAG
jgi:hypothetical protein